MAGRSGATFLRRRSSGLLRASTIPSRSGTGATRMFRIERPEEAENLAERAEGINPS